MRIISTTDLSRQGNDCYIHSSISLMESCNLYFVILVEKVSGYPYHEDVIIIDEAKSDKDKAIYIYKQNGGKLNETK